MIKTVNQISKVFILLYSILYISNNVSGQETIIYDGNISILSISSKMDLFEDENSQLTVSQIVNSNISGFTYMVEGIPSFSYTKSTIWCRFKINNISNKECYLEVSPPILNNIVLYEVMENGIDSTCKGSIQPSVQPEDFLSSNYVFRLNPEAKYYLLKVISKTKLFIDANIGDYDSIVNKNTKNDIIQWCYAGLIIMILFYNLFLFYTNRKSIYIYYVLHLANSIIFFLYVSGYGILLIWPNWLNSNFMTVMSLGFILSIVFVYHFLDAKTRLPKLNLVLKLLIIALGINSFIDLFISSHLAGILLNYFGLAGVIIIMVGGYILTKRGVSHAKTFLYAWAFYLVGIGMQNLQSLNFVETNLISTNAIQIGSAFEIVLLSLAIGNKIKFYKEEKEKASKKEKQLLEEKKLLLSSKKEELEKKLLKKTETLYKKNKKLKEQNKEIKNIHKKISEQNIEYLKYNDLLESKNKIITNQNYELKAHRDNLEKSIDEKTGELQEAAIKAETADQLKTAFLKDFSHEIRTPMNAISGFSSLLSTIDPEDKSHDYYVKIINDHTDNLLDLIDNIVDFSRIDAGKLVLKKVKFDPEVMFNLLYEKSLKQLKTQRKTDVELILEQANIKNIRLNLDYNRFWKIIYQIIDNSIKYTEKGHIQFGYSIPEGSKDIKIFIKDTGPGINDDELEFVFESFRQMGSHKSKLKGGMGLGLSLAKGLVDLMGGEIRINTVTKKDEQKDDSGTYIEVLIPNCVVGN